MTLMIALFSDAVAPARASSSLGNLPRRDTGYDELCLNGDRPALDLTGRVAVPARPRARTRTKTVVIAHTHLTLRAIRTVAVTLNATGRALLAKLGRLETLVTVTANPTDRTLAMGFPVAIVLSGRLSPLGRSWRWPVSARP